MQIVDLVAAEMGGVFPGARVLADEGEIHGGVAAQLGEVAAVQPRIGAKCVVGEVAVGEQAGAGAIRELAGGAALGGVGGAYGTASNVEGDLGQTVECEGFQAGDDAVADLAGRQIRGNCACAPAPRRNVSPTTSRSRPGRA